MLQTSISGLRYIPIPSSVVSFPGQLAFDLCIGYHLKAIYDAEEPDEIRPLVPRTESHFTDQGPENKNFPAIEAIEMEKPHPIPFHEIPSHFKFTKTRGTDVRNHDKWQP